MLVWPYPLTVSNPIVRKKSVENKLTLFIVRKIFIADNGLWWRFELDMKITEIRNNLFRLSDLKGLISENIDEAKTIWSLDWSGYFTAHKESLGEEFPVAWPKILDYFGEKRILDSFLNGSLAGLEWQGKPTPEIQNKDIYNFMRANFKSGKKANKKKMLATQTGTDGENQLEVFFKERYNKPNINPDDVQLIYRVAKEARMTQEFGGMKILFGPEEFDLANPYSVFLFFFFDLQDRRGHSAFIDDIVEKCLVKAREYDEVNGTNFLNAIQGFTGNYKKEKSLYSSGFDRIIDEALLRNLNLTFLNSLNESEVSLIFRMYFTKPGLPEIRGVIDSIEQNNLADSAFNFKTLKKYGDTVGGFLLTAMSIIYTCLNGDFNGGIDLATDFLGDPMFSGIRAAAFQYVYQTKFGLDGMFIKDIMDFFGTDQVELFDLSSGQIDMNKINVGLERWYRKYNIQGFNNLSRIKQTDFSISNAEEETGENILFIEAIASSAEMLLTFASQKFTKYEISHKTEIGFEDLLGNASDGLKKMAMFKKSIPAPQQRLTEISKSFGERDVKLWEVLNVDNNINDKTQMNIFVFLRQNSDGDVSWDYEYNRPGRRETTDEGLGDKSIDIMGTKGDTKICFEYQGQQHFKPFNVRESDYENEFFTGIRDAILKECGYVVVGKNGTRFVKRSSIGKLTTEQKKSIILKVFSEKLLELGNLAKMQQAASPGGSKGSDFIFKEPVKDPDTKRRARVDEKIHFEKLNRRDLTVLEAEGYFSDIVSKGTLDEGTFKNPEVGGMIPYIGSPFRYLEEIKTAEDMTNDQMKSEVIKSRGWIMSYIIPGGCSEDEVEYTKQMSTNNSVFTWDNAGKEELLTFLAKNGFRAKMISESKASLFQSIVNDVLRENFFE